jgi:hypothetical protein
MSATYTQEYAVNSITNPNPNHIFLFGTDFIGSSGDLIQDVQTVDSEYGYTESEFAVTNFRLVKGQDILASLEVTLGATDSKFYFEIDMSTIAQFNGVWLLVNNPGGGQGFNCEIEEVSNNIVKCGLEVTARYHEGKVKVNRIVKIRKYVE